ncbi:MAG: CAP domain-containing protein [Thermoanaerobaculia bacterium]
MYPVLTALLLLLLMQAPPVVQGPPPPTPDEVRHRLLEIINGERAAAGSGPLHLREPLNRVAQQNAEEARDNEGAMYDEKSIPRIQGRLRQAGYQAHGWHQAFVAGKENPDALVAWIKRENPDAYKSLIEPDYHELGIGISDLKGTPLYDFFLAWRESESFARQTASLSDLNQARADMLARVNAERAKDGRPALKLDPRLNEAAQKHAEDMLLRSYYDHFSPAPEKTSPIERARKAGYAPRIVAENIARGPFTVNEVMDNWMLSREHRGNLLHPAFRDLGVGIAVGRNSVGLTVLWVQDFGSP